MGKEKMRKLKEKYGQNDVHVQGSSLSLKEMKKHTKKMPLPNSVIPVDLQGILLDAITKGVE